MVWSSFDSKMLRLLLQTSFQRSPLDARASGEVKEMLRCFVVHHTKCVVVGDLMEVGVYVLATRVVFSSISVQMSTCGTCVTSEAQALRVKGFWGLDNTR